MTKREQNRKSTENVMFKNGIKFVEGIERTGNGHTPKVSEKAFERAIARVMPQVHAVTNEFNRLPEKYRMSEAIVDVEIVPGFLSKSNKVTELYDKSELERVGSLPIKLDEDNTQRTRVEFVRGKPALLDELIQDISNGKRVTQRLRAEVVRIESVSLTHDIQKRNLVPLSWKSGRVTLLLHPMQDKASVVEKIHSLLPEQKTESWQVYESEDGMLYLSLVLTNTELMQILPFNALRQVMPNPTNPGVQVEGGFGQVRNLIPDASYTGSTGQITIGQIDGGFRQDGNPFLTGLKTIGEVQSPATEYFREHGTAVGSILMYGNLDHVLPGQPLPAMSKVKMIRVLPTGVIEQGNNFVEDFDMVTATKLIKEIIPQNRDVKVWNISVGPFGPVLDEVIAPLTAALDELAFKYKILFCIAVGNTGEMGPGLWARIQSPADMVNGLGVGAFEYNEEGTAQLARYTSIGPGREGSVIKPDFLTHGGNVTDCLLTFSTSNFLLNRAFGTSFSTPMVARLAAQLMVTDDELTPLDAKALLIHQSLQNPLKEATERMGRGFINDVPEILTSSDNEFRILYSSEMTTKTYAQLNIPIPEGLESKRLEISWTVATMTRVSPSEADEYAQSTIEDNFYPNADKYDFRKDGLTRSRLINDEDVERLVRDGWKKSVFPTPNRSRYQDLSEFGQRKLLKWDSVKCDRVVKSTKLINHPFLILHAMSRKNTYDRIPYSVVITVRAVNDNDLYQAVSAQFPILEPLHITDEARLRMQN
ncbi:S8 family peptidase [Lactiplantibacillus plantarum]|uniref:S8 family peptidase n=1 Tax=Lactiplantibacillus plantarum TaxID=1590 RepID=UPI0011CB99FB|nr:S8 family peptidase [Lactiplantibacillus plantarum]MDO8182861.1 S8 family peptidase [Lactiplantibacillus plantarum]TXJ91742.1 S8 family peptidase [Lactiplantibacillus plantarum]